MQDDRYIALHGNMIYALRVRGLGSRVNVDSIGPYITLSVINNLNEDIG